LPLASSLVVETPAVLQLRSETDVKSEHSIDPASILFMKNGSSKREIYWHSPIHSLSFSSRFTKLDKSTNFLLLDFLINPLEFSHFAGLKTPALHQSTMTLALKQGHVDAKSNQNSTTKE
jgi:hypothetical protein